LLQIEFLKITKKEIKKLEKSDVLQTTSLDHEVAIPKSFNKALMQMVLLLPKVGVARD
jgi:hypothetical protein